MYANGDRQGSSPRWGRQGPWSPCAEQWKEICQVEKAKAFPVRGEQWATTLSARCPRTASLEGCGPALGALSARLCLPGPHLMSKSFLGTSSGATTLYSVYMSVFVRNTPTVGTYVKKMWVAHFVPLSPCTSPPILLFLSWWTMQGACFQTFSNAFM